jgi:hypothetical protein
MGFSYTTSEQTHYGWAQISVSADSLALTIDQWAYGAAGQSITVGAVPEPSTYAALAGLVALGATVVVRRRQQPSVAVAA